VLFPPPGSRQGRRRSLAEDGAKRAIELTAKWGAYEVRGLDPKRAEAIGLKPIVMCVGYATGKTLPPILQDAGPCARFMRRLAELCLQNSKHWKNIEENTRETQKHYKEMLTMARVREEAYRMAADILGKIMERPGLLSNWAEMAPGLLRSKKREMELQKEGTHMYLEVLKELTRIELIYDAVIALIKIEHDRPIRTEDIKKRWEVVGAKAQDEQSKILAQEAQLARELKDIGDGSETILKYQSLLEESLPTNQCNLKAQQLLSAPLPIFSLTHLELLDLSHNAISVLPGEVCQLTLLKKLYVNNNKLTTLPPELHKLSLSLTLLAAGDNPFENGLMQLYLAGLPVLMAYLKTCRHRGKSANRASPPHAAANLNLFPSPHATDLPDYRPPQTKDFDEMEQ